MNVFYFDFDGTLSTCVGDKLFNNKSSQYSSEMYDLRYNNPKEFYERVFGGKKRIKTISSLLKYLKDKGNKVYIISIARHLEIINCLKYLNLIHLIDDIFDYGVLKDVTKLNETKGIKINFIQHHQTNLKLYNFDFTEKVNKLYLIDDCEKNFYSPNAETNKDSSGNYFINCLNVKINGIIVSNGIDDKDILRIKRLS